MKSSRIKKAIKENKTRKFERYKRKKNCEEMTNLKISRNGKNGTKKSNNIFFKIDVNI